MKRAGWRSQSCCHSNTNGGLGAKKAISNKYLQNWGHVSKECRTHKKRNVVDKTRWSVDEDELVSNEDCEDLMDGKINLQIKRERSWPLL